MRKSRFLDGLYLTLVILILFGLVGKLENSFQKNLQAKDVLVANASTVKTPIALPTVAPENDIRVEKLQAYLEKRNSPLAEHAAYIIQKSDEYALDWTLMIAIAGKESGYGLAAPDGSHNPFGLGGSNFIWFDSWEEAIDYEAELLSDEYRYQMIEGMQEKYCPSVECAADWTETIYGFAEDILAGK